MLNVVSLAMSHEISGLVHFKTQCVSLCLTTDYTIVPGRVGLQVLFVSFLYCREMDDVSVHGKRHCGQGGGGESAAVLYMYIRALPSDSYRPSCPGSSVGRALA